MKKHIPYLIRFNVFLINGTIFCTYHIASASALNGNKLHGRESEYSE